MNEEISRWEARVEALTNVPLFSEVARHDLERLAATATERVFEANEEIVSEGEAGDSMFIITSGEAEVLLGDTHVADLGVRDFLGEMALFRNTPRSATVRAKTGVSTLRITQWDLDRELRDNPSIAIQMLGVLSDRLHAADQEVISAFGQRVRDRRDHLGLSQEALAERAGLDRTFVGSVERGERNVSLDNIHAIAVALGVPAGELVGD